MFYTAREIADHVGGRLEGNAAARISGVASPENAGSEDAIYVESVRHAERAAASAAGCVFAHDETRVPGKTRIVVPRPKLAFAKTAALLIAPARIASGVHPTAVISSLARVSNDAAVGPYAVIEDDADIGSGSQVGAHCFIGAGARLGSNCRLHPRVTLYPGAWLGDRVEVHSGAVIGSDGFGYVYGDGRQWKFPQIGRVEIGDDVEIGANTTIDRGALDVTRISAGCKLDNLIQVAHNVHIGENSVLAAQTGISGSSVLGANVMAAGQVGVADHCLIGDGAILGAQCCVITGKTVRAGEFVLGFPARPLEKFKQQHGWLSRLPELARRVQKLEQDRS